MTDKPRRIGLMGFGVVASGHARAITEAPELELAAVVDPDPTACRRAREKFGVERAVQSIDDFFDSRLDAVSIISPAPVHKQNVEEAADHGLPMLCEKPLSMDADEAEAMIEVAERAGVPLHVAFCYRFSPVALSIREMVRDGRIGRVRSLRLIYNWDVHGKYETDESGARVKQARREGRMLEGGPMVDCGTHQIDLATFWMGPVARWDAHGAWVDDYDAPDHMWLHLDHRGGAHTMVEISYSYHHTAKNPRREFVYELIGSDGVIRYDREARRFVVEDTDGLTELPFAGEKNFTDMYRHWAAALVGKDHLLPDARHGQEVTRIARDATEQVVREKL